MMESFGPLQAWHMGGTAWSRAAVASLHELCGFQEKVAASQPSLQEKLPPVRECTLALAITGLGLRVPFTAVFTLSPSQLRYVHIIREPFEMIVATVMHHGHRGNECDVPAYRVLCKRLEAKVASPKA